MLAFDEIGLPLYNGLESAHEDVVYSFLRGFLEKRGYSLKVKRSGHPEVDSVIRSGKGAAHGKGSCDAYVFSGRGYEDFFGLLELESTGKLNLGISQIKDYAESFMAKTLHATSKAALKNLRNTELLLVVFDGQKIWVATYSLKNEKYKVLIDSESLSTDRQGLSKRVYAQFPQRNVRPVSVDEKQLIDFIANIIRGHERLQKNKALVMTVLASIYGATQDLGLDAAIGHLTDSQDKFDRQILDTYRSLLKDLAASDQQLLAMLYAHTAPKLYSLSHEKGMDLYGYIYEELATKDTKKEQGEYYTPRHTIRPVLAALQRNYLRWEKDDLKNKVVFDPFCGSGGFLYEYIRMHKAAHNLTREEVDHIASSSVFGADKNSVRPAYLNLYLIGDGSANLQQVRTSINWRKSFLYEVATATGTRKAPKAERISEPHKVSTSLKKSKADLSFLLGMYNRQLPEAELETQVTSALAEGADDPVRHAIARRGVANTAGDHGLVDLLVTNVPYGRISNPIERFTEQGQTPYGNSLEANALRECIDFLRPAQMHNGQITAEGGIGAIVVPDSILENPTNAAIREYLVTRCDVLAVIGLPPFTFSPYAMEKTYILVIRKIAPEQYNVNRDLSGFNTFMYYSLADGKANSVNRFPTRHMVETEVTLQGGSKKLVAEFCHNDFDPCFDTYFAAKSLYLSKLERAWSGQTYSLNPGWDQERLLEDWTGKGWKREPGKKWGYFSIERSEREVRELLRRKSLEGKIASACADLITEVETGNQFIEMDSVKAAMATATLSAAERAAFNDISHVEVSVADDGTRTVALFTSKTVPEIVLNPDDSRYLGERRPVRDIDDAFKDLENSKDALTYESVLDYFQSVFTGKNARAFVLSDEFSVLQGTQFSKEDAYNNPGQIPVFTAATDGPAYDCAADIPGKTLVKGPGLIWSRKGAKAGTIQLFAPDVSEPQQCYITDVSGIIKAKPSSADVDWTFLQMFLAGQVRSEIQAQDNNAQLNKTKLESIRVLVPDNHQEIGKLLRDAGL